MGIQGLFTYILKYVDSSLEWHKLHNCKIVIDGNNLAHEIYSNSSNLSSAYGGDYDKYAAYVEDFFKKLQKCKIRPYVIMDGGHPIQRDKFDTLYTRCGEAITASLNNSFPIKSSFRVFPIMGYSIFANVIEKLGIPVIQCDFEADDEIAVVAKQLGDACILSNDSDFYLFGCPFILLNSMNFKRIQKEKCDDGRTIHFIPCYKFNPDVFCNITGVPKDLLPLFAPILGNDFLKTNVMNSFYYKLKHFRPHSRLVTLRHKIIISVIKWLSDQTEDPLTVLDKVLDSLSLEISDNTRKIFRSTFSMYFPSNTLLTPWLITHSFHCPSRSKKQMSSLNLTEIDTELNYEGFLPLELKSELQCICDERVGSLNIVEGVTFPDWFIKAYRLYLIPPMICDILNQDYLFAVPQIEVVELESVYLAVEFLLNKVRAILWLTVDEGCSNSHIASNKNRSMIGKRKFNSKENAIQNHSKDYGIGEINNSEKIMTTRDGQEVQSESESDVVIEEELYEGDDVLSDENPSEVENYTLLISNEERLSEVKKDKLLISSEEKLDEDDLFISNKEKFSEVEDDLLASSEEKLTENEDDLRISNEERLSEVDDKNLKDCTDSSVYESCESEVDNEESAITVSTNNGAKWINRDHIDKEKTNVFNQNNGNEINNEVDEIVKKFSSTLISNNEEDLDDLYLDDSCGSLYETISSIKTYGFNEALHPTDHNISSVEDGHNISSTKDGKHIGEFKSFDMLDDQHCDVLIEENYDLDCIENENTKVQKEFGELLIVKNEMKKYEFDYGDFSKEDDENENSVTNEFVCSEYKNAEHGRELFEREACGQIDLDNNALSCDLSVIEDDKTNLCEREEDNQSGEDDVQWNDDSKRKKKRKSKKRKIKAIVPNELAEGETNIFKIRNRIPLKMFKKNRRLPPLNWYIRENNRILKRELPCPSIEQLKDLPSLFQVENMNLEEKRNYFYSICSMNMKFSEKIPPDIEFMLYCICYWRYKFCYTTDRSLVLSYLMCILMFCIIDGKTGAQRLKGTPNNLSLNKIDQLIKSGSLPDPSTLSISELICSLTMEECQLAKISLLQFHETKFPTSAQSYDRKLVHSFSNMQVLVYFLQLINGLLCFPFPYVSMNSFWSGSFCYNIRKKLFTNKCNVTSILSNLFTENTRIINLFLRLYGLLLKPLNLPDCTNETILLNNMSNKDYKPKALIDIKTSKQSNLKVKNSQNQPKKKKQNIKELKCDKIRNPTEDQKIRMAENKFSALLF